MKCFYHSSDFDGHCSGAIIKREYPECEMIGINYGQEFPWESVEGDLIFMVDFALQPFSDMLRLNSICKLYWIDHHKTAIDAANNSGFLASGKQVLVDGKAACELVWEFINPHIDIPYGVSLLGRYDVWDHSDPHTLPFQYGLRQHENTLPSNQELWEKVFSNKQFIFKVIKEGELLLAYEKSQNEKFCKSYSFEILFNGMSCICANKGFSNSKLFDSVYSPEKYHLMITFCRMSNGMWTVSLYSTRDDIDCGMIAKSFGGGGHKGAAGFQCDVLPFSF